MRRVILIPALLLCLSILSGCAAYGKTASSGKQGSASSRHRLPPAPAKKNASKPGSSQPVTIRENLQIPILVYHHVRPTGEWKKTTWSWKMSVSPDIFDRQMKWLKDKGYTSISMDILAAILTGKETGPEKPVVITFDDNTPTSYAPGADIMLKHRQMAVYYIITNKLGSSSVINTEKVLDLAAKGMDIQSHTISHAGLTNVADDQLASELAESKRVLEELLGKPVNHIAYPLTAHNQRVRDATKAAGYVTATIMDPRKATMKDDLMKLPRIMMTDETDVQKLLP